MEPRHINKNKNKQWQTPDSTPPSHHRPHAVNNNTMVKSRRGLPKNQKQEELKKGNTTVEQTKWVAKVESWWHFWTKPWNLSTKVEPGEAETSVKPQGWQPGKTLEVQGDATSSRDWSDDRGLAEQGDAGGSEDQGETGGKEDPGEAEGVEDWGTAGCPVHSKTRVMMKQGGAGETKELGGALVMTDQGRAEGAQS